MVMDRRVRTHGQPPREEHTRQNKATHGPEKEHARPETRVNDRKHTDRSKPYQGYRYTTKVRFRALNLSMDTEYHHQRLVKTL